MPHFNELESLPSSSYKPLRIFTPSGAANNFSPLKKFFLSRLQSVSLQTPLRRTKCGPWKNKELRAQGALCVLITAHGCLRHGLIISSCFNVWAKHPPVDFYASVDGLLSYSLSLRNSDFFALLELDGKLSSVESCSLSRQGSEWVS